MVTNKTKLNSEEINLGLCSISKRLIPAKLAYLFISATSACTIPYGTAFLVSVGLSVTQAGLIMGFRLIPALFISPLIGAAADHLGKHKIVVVVVATMALIVTLPQPWIAKALSKSASQNITGVFNSTSAPSIYSGNSDNTLMFSVLFFIMICMGIFGVPLPGFIDSAVMRLVKGCKNTTYGQQRVFAPVGFAIGSFFAGYVSDRYNDPTMSKYTGVYFVHAVSILLTTILLCILDQSRSEIDLNGNEVKNELQSLDGSNDCDDILEDSVKHEVREKKDHTMKQLFKTCCNFRVLFYLFIVCQMGMSFFLVNAYMVLLMDDLGSSRTIVGLTNTASSVSELLTFPITAVLIKWFGGNYPSFSIAAASYSIRFLLMSFIENPWLFLPVQCLQSFGFAVFWVAANEYTYAISSKEISASMFLVVSSIYLAFGGFLANITGALIYQNYGGRILFRVASANCAVVAILICLFYFKFEKRFEREKAEEKQNLKLTDTV